MKSLAWMLLLVLLGLSAAEAGNKRDEAAIARRAGAYRMSF